jgi:glycosyltransferase involved in cell wall biosynthesis
VAISLPGLFRALRDRGIESSVVTAGEPRGSAEGVSAAKFDLAGVEAMLGNVDAVHLHGWGTDLARGAASVARRKGKSYIISPLGGLSEGPYRKKSWRDRLRDMFAGQTLIRRAAAVATLNDWECRDLQSRNINARVLQLPYGLNVDEYQRGGSGGAAESKIPEQSDGRCLLLLGPIHPVEGLVPFLKAFAEILSEAEGWSILVAGAESGDWQKMIEAAIRRKGASDLVRLVRAPDIATQQALLNRADLLVSPALHVRCPVSIMQAMAMGVVVIASESVAPDGLNGEIITCAANRGQIKQALRTVIGLSDEERSSKARQARAVARRVFDWSVAVEHYVKLYESLR